MDCVKNVWVRKRSASADIFVRMETVWVYVFPYRCICVNSSRSGVTVYLQKPSEEFSYLKGYDEIQTECPVQEPFDVYFALDCSGDRLGDAETYFQNAKKKINIDHHISNSGCGDVNLVRPEVGSACEVLYHIMDAELIDKDIAEALYTGIIHDTGVFQYSNTTPETAAGSSVSDLLRIQFPEADRGKLLSEDLSADPDQWAEL